MEKKLDELKTYKRTKVDTKTDSLADVIQCLLELRNTKMIPDSARIVGVYGNFGSPRAYEITVEWSEEEQIESE
jgi:hypothetical protein